MSILRALEKRASPENPSTNLANPAAWFTDYMGGGSTAAGVSVNNESALSLSAVYACIRVIAETVASLPLPVYQRIQPRGKERARDHRLYQTLHDRPNPEMSSFTFWETLGVHAVGWGNAYAEIQRDGGGRAMALWPLLPNRVEPFRESDGTKKYKVQVGSDNLILPADRVLHIPGMGFDGLKGYNPIALHRQSLGLALAAEEFGARYFGNGSRASGVLTHPGKLSGEAHERLRKSWAEMQSGLSNAHRAAILEEGMQWAQTSIPPNEAQFLETRKFQVAEVARLFRVPLHLIGDLERSTNNNIEHQSLEFVIHTIRPWLVRFEKAINHDLFNEQERATYFAEFLVDGLLRGDLKSRYEAYAVGRNWGWLSANDVRELENQNPIGEDGEMYLVPSNMIPADQAEAIAEKMAAPAPAPAALPAPRALPDPERIRAAFGRVIRSEADQMIAREVKAVGNALDKAETRGIQDFHAWLGEFYERQASVLERAYLPALLGLAEALGMESEDEVRRHVRSVAEAEARASEDALRAVLRDVPAEQQIPALRGVLDEWARSRPDTIAARESRRAVVDPLPLAA